MNDPVNSLVIFTLDAQRFCLPLSQVERVVSAVEVTRLPATPENVLGIINIQGHIVPVFNVRKRLGFVEREVDIDDHFLVARGARWTVALAVDAVVEVVDTSDAQCVAGGTFLPGLTQIEGVFKMPGGMLLIQDLDRFLTLDEAATLDAALDTATVSS